MQKFIDITGLKFGLWTVLCRVEPYSTPVYWLCECECGTVKQVQGGSLKNGGSKGCSSCAHKTHGKAASDTYRVWVNMRQRCENSNHPQFKDYGGRGISVCKHWSSFNNFLHDMGEKPKGGCIERIDNNKGYHKENCIWASRVIQGRNTRSTKLSAKLVAYIRKSDKTNSELAKELNVTPSCICQVRNLVNWRDV